MRHESQLELAAVTSLPRDSQPLEAQTPRLDTATRIAVVHDWCPTFRGGERVLAQICKQFPDAEVFTLFDFLSDDVKEQYFKDVAFHTSAANKLPMIEKYYRSLFFLCPFLIEQFDVTGYDLVISSSAAFSRGVLTRPDQPHLCYVHSPVRYAWDEQFSYLQQGRLGFGPKGLLFRHMLHKLRTWDTRTAHGPDMMLANSSYVRSRIRHIYGRDSQVVFPPVALDELTYAADKDDYYVVASYLAPYKRTDLVIQAFNEMPSRRLVVVGEGQQSKALRDLAGPNITFTGYLPRADYVRTVAEAKAMVFAGCEDFGIALARRRRAARRWWRSAAAAPATSSSRSARPIGRPACCSAARRWPRSRKRSRFSTTTAGRSRPLPAAPMPAASPRTASTGPCWTRRSASRQSTPSEESSPLIAGQASAALRLCSAGPAGAAPTPSAAAIASR